ncbi:hypothetical protein [Alkaliphilus crotonatoxidans]
MNIKWVRIGTYILFGLFLYSRHRSFNEVLKESNKDQRQEHIIRYIHKFELRAIVMWFFIMLNLILIMENL